MGAVEVGFVTFEDEEGNRYGPEYWREQLSPKSRESRGQAYRTGPAEGWAWDKGFEAAYTRIGAPARPTEGAWDEFCKSCWDRESTRKAFEDGWKRGRGGR